MAPERPEVCRIAVRSFPRPEGTEGGEAAAAAYGSGPQVLIFHTLTMCAPNDRPIILAVILTLYHLTETLTPTLTLPGWARVPVGSRQLDRLQPQP